MEGVVDAGVLPSQHGGVGIMIFSSMHHRAKAGGY